MTNTSMKMAMSRVLIAGVAILLATGAHAADDTHLSVADYLDLEQVSDAQISPDGGQIIYTRRWVDQQADRMSSALWIMDADQDTEPCAAGLASDPRLRAVLDSPLFEAPQGPVGNLD